MFDGRVLVHPSGFHGLTHASSLPALRHFWSTTKPSRDGTAVEHGYVEYPRRQFLSFFLSLTGGTVVKPTVNRCSFLCGVFFGTRKAPASSPRWRVPFFLPPLKVAWFWTVQESVDNLEESRHCCCCCEVLEAMRPAHCRDNSFRPFLRFKSGGYK